MEFDWITILTIILGNGAVITAFGLIFNWRQNKSQRDFEARRDAKEYYMKLYGHIAILDELVTSYPRSIKNGKAKVFIFKDCIYSELTSKQIRGEFKEAYNDFSSFYIKKKSEGYEIFLPKKLAKLLSNLWFGAKIFYEDEENMNNNEEIDSFHNLVEETTSLMEKIFGLK